MGEEELIIRLKAHSWRLRAPGVQDDRVQRLIGADVQAILIGSAEAAVGISVFGNEYLAQQFGFGAIHMDAVRRACEDVAVGVTAESVRLAGAYDSELARVGELPTVLHIFSGVKERHIPMRQQDRSL